MLEHTPGSGQRASLILAQLSLDSPGEIYTLVFSPPHFILYYSVEIVPKLFVFCACLLLDGKLCRRHFVYHVPLTMSGPEYVCHKRLMREGAVLENCLQP